MSRSRSRVRASLALRSYRSLFINSTGHHNGYCFNGRYAKGAAARRLFMTHYAKAQPIARVLRFVRHCCDGNNDTPWTICPRHRCRINHDSRTREFSVSPGRSFFFDSSPPSPSPSPCLPPSPSLIQEIERERDGDRDGDRQTDRQCALSTGAVASGSFVHAMDGERDD